MIHGTLTRLQRTHAGHTPGDGHNSVTAPPSLHVTPQRSEKSMKTSIILFLAVSLFCHGDTLISIYELSEKQTEKFSVPVSIDDYHQGYRPENPAIRIENLKNVELTPSQDSDSKKKISIWLTKKDEELLGELTEKIVPGKLYLDASGIIDSAPFLRNPYLSGPINLEGTKNKVSKLYAVFEKDTDSAGYPEQDGYTTRD